MRYLFFAIFYFSLAGFVNSQDTTKILRIGMQCPSIVVTTSQNSIQSFNFPYSHKVSLVHFWSSSASKSLKDLYKLSLIYNKYSVEPFKNSEGYDMITVALQSDRNEWQENLKKYQLKTLNNGIALKGFNDFYIKTFKLTEVPATLLVDEYGKIIAINPDVNTIINILDEKRDVLNDPKAVTKIIGKIAPQNNPSSFLINKKVYLLNNSDTLQSTITNANGEFVFDNADLAGKRIFIFPETPQTENLWLLNVKEEIVGEFSPIEKNFGYSLSSFDLLFLKASLVLNIKNKDVTASETFLNEDLFLNGGFVLDFISKGKLDKIISKLKLSPSNISIITHTDCKGDAKNNKDLSLKRSVAIVNYLAIKGIAIARLKAIGMGEEEPLNKCVDGIKCTEKELKANRRTEIKVYQNE